MNKKKLIYLGLSGASGRMGKAVREAVQQKNSDFIISVSWPKARPTKTIRNAHKITMPTKRQSNAHSIQAVVDFSSPELLEWTLKWCVLNKKPLVSGTTGLNKKQKQLLKTAAKSIPVFYESNMSWGIWLMKNWIKKFSAPKNVSIQLEDIHHKNKKDQPSGTALKLINCFSPATRKKVLVQSTRKGREFGIHRICFTTEDEVLRLEHQALNRRLFAKGALNIIRWLIKQKPGFYCLDDIYT